METGANTCNASNLGAEDTGHSELVGLALQVFRIPLFTYLKPKSNSPSAAMNVFCMI